MTPYGGDVIKVSASSLPTHNDHGDRLVDVSVEFELGDACDVELVYQVPWSDVDGDGFGESEGVVEFCGTTDALSFKTTTLLHLGCHYDK